MVLAMALSNSAAIPSYHAEEVSNHVRYGNHLQAEHYRFGRRRGGCCGCCGGGYGGGCYGGGCYGGGCYGGGGYGGVAYGGCYGGGCTGGYAGYSGGCAGGHVVTGAPGTSGYVMDGYGMPYGSAYMGEVPYGTSGGVMTMPADRSGYERRDQGTGEPTDRGERRDNRGNDRRDNSRDRGNRESRADAPATLLVTLPADARLTVDGQPTRSTSGERTFETPPLPTDKDFSYTLKAEITRDGHPVTVTRHVTVRGGEESRVDITFPEATASR
jgi:uncharacterized protein (TIGR03000 family)